MDELQQQKLPQDIECQLPMVIYGLRARITYNRWRLPYGSPRAGRLVVIAAVPANFGGRH